MEDAVPQVELESEVQISIHSSRHMDTLLSSLEEQRKKNFLCDITLVVETVQFRAHKALLAASSEYFAMMFADEGNIGQSIYVIEGMVAEVFETLLQFIYTGNVHVSEKCLKHTVATAQILKVDNLVEAYADYLQNQINEANASDNRTDEADDSVSKRKRGRPKKLSDQTNTPADAKSVVQADGESPETIEDTCYSNGSILHVADFAAEVTCDMNPKPQEEQLILQRHSKRRPQRSIKLQEYRVGEDNEEREPSKQSVGKKKQTGSEACNDCGKVFKYKHFLAIHHRMHTGERPFRCAQCGQGFSQKHSLRVHERIHTGEKPYSCTVCSKSLASKRSLMEHVLLHTETKSFVCDKCGKFFSQKRQLKSHYRVHIGGGLPECKFCQRKFMDSAQLKKHLRTHTGERPFTCEMCGKSFTAKSSLLTHMRIHRGEKPYSCNVCGKAFADSSAKRRHLSLHTGKKPYSCSDCNVQFTRLDNLKAHIKSHSKVKKTKPPVTNASTKAKEEIRSKVLTQQYRLVPPNAQEVQLLVTDSIHNLNFMPGQGPGPGQSITLVPAEASPAIADQTGNLTLITHPPPLLHGLQVAPHGLQVAPHGLQVAPHGLQGAPHQQQVQPIHNIDLSRVQTVLPEQMHVVTLSKEAFDQLQVRTHEIRLTQTDRQTPLTRVQAHPATTILNQSVRVPEHAQQTVTLTPVPQPVPGHPIPAPSFQIQAGAVSFVNTALDTTNSSSA